MLGHRKGLKKLMLWLLGIIEKLFMLATVLHRKYRLAIVDRLTGSNPNVSIPKGGRTQRLLLEAMFLVMGKVAKMDGCVISQEIEYASSIMQLMGLNCHEKKLAIDFFEKGKLKDTDVFFSVSSLARAIGKKSELADSFIKIQCRHAFVKGGLRLKEKILLRNVAEILGFQKAYFLDICAEISGYRETSNRNLRNFPNDAYRVLQLEPDVEDGEIRRAYLLMMMRYHPDKLICENLTEESLKQAQEKSVAIRSAYETVCGHRNIRV